MPYKLPIVDDSKLARMSAAKALSCPLPRLDAGWRRQRRRGAIAYHADVVRRRPPGFQHAGRDGLELAAELLALHPSTPLAVVSANHQEEIVRPATTSGRFFSPKPLTEQALGAFLQDAVRRLERRRHDCGADRTAHRTATRRSHRAPRQEYWCEPRGYESAGDGRFAGVPVGAERLLCRPEPNAIAISGRTRDSEPGSGPSGLRR